MMVTERHAAAGLTGLVADIGGTHARFAIAQVAGGAVTLRDVRSLPGADYPSAEAAAQAYLAQIGAPALGGAVAACAGPVVDGSVTFTNVPWTTTERGFGKAIGLAHVHLINDLAAAAWGAPALAPGGLRLIAQEGPLAAPKRVAESLATIAILNAGTGCNASAFVHTASGEALVVGEYGHSSFAAEDAVELEIWRRLQARFGRVSIERVLSGPGLLNLYRALCEIAGTTPQAETPAAVSAAAAAADAVAQQAIARFCAIMGSVAGDVALCYGARGGVYLSGGVAMLLLSESYDTAFRQRFEDKGRMRSYLADIPTRLILDDQLALFGAARAMAAFRT
jgi:glucokinase